MDPPLTSKVLRAPSLKRGQENIRIQDRIKLERVLGVTVSSNAALDCDTTSEIVAYPAGCTVVLFNPRKNTQSHVVNACKKTVTSLALAGDGRLLVTGECGHMPNVRVWDISDQQNPIQIAEFPTHKYGINCVAFSPSNKYVVSIGSQHDMIVNVWDWRNNVKVASNKVSSKVKAVSFAENGSYFVTVGNRHVKFWYLEYSRSAKYKEPVPLMGRSAILGEQRNNDFVDVACGRGEMADSTYAITKTGLLCEFNNRRLLDKWVELRTTSANCMAVGEKYIFIGCAEGIVRCFSPVTLQFITTLPRTHYLGVDVAHGLSISHMSQHPPNARYPDAIALAFDELNNKLTCVYNDHSIYVWDVRDIKRVGKSHSFLYHSACIWGVEMYPTSTDSINAMPPGSFITCSSDDTVRVWNLQKDLPQDQGVYNRNIYSKELLKVLYVDPELAYLKDLDLAAAGSAEKNDTSYDSRNGVRSIRISPDGRHIASGDRSGNIRIHDVATLDEICLIEAHDAEVLCLEYSKYTQNSSEVPRLLASASRDRLIHVFNVDEGYNFLQTLDDHSSSITAVRFFTQTSQSDKIQMVSCGADKSIIFRQMQMTPGGAPQFVRDHNAQGKTTLYDMEVDSGQKHVLTACQDRNIRVYNVATGKHSKTFKGSVGEDGSLIKVVLDTSGIYVATSCTDKTLCVYDYYSGECMATMLGHSELVTGLRFSPDCRHLVSASGDGCIFVWRVPHDMVVTMQARLAQQAMRAGKRPPPVPNGLAIQLDNETFGPPSPEFLDPNANMTMQSTADYRFSVGQLPHWAKKQINTNASNEENLSSSVRSLGVDMPKGRWAQRVQQTDGITVKSVYDSDEIIPFPPSRGAIDSDGGGGGAGGSKDSSIDSGTETKCSSDYRRETITIKREEDESVFALCPDSYRELTEDSKQMTGGNVTVTRGSNVTELTRQSRTRHHTDDSSLGSFKFEDHESTEHDGDVEDYSEGENGTTGSEKSHHHLMYYPAPEDTVSNQFKVNAMDVEELRRSMRRGKKSRGAESTRSSELTTASGSQDDSDSEGGASTPSAERNPLSMLSEASSEGFDQVANQTHREKYLKNAFESLSGADEPTNRKKSSISSQFHGRFSGGGENQENKTHPTVIISAPKNTKLSSDTTKKREELQRRIEETRRKLQSVGYRSSLKASQSISDLTSHIPDRHHRANRIGSGNKCAQSVYYTILTNPCIKPQPTSNSQLKSQLSTNVSSGFGNTIKNLQEPDNKSLPKSKTMSSINDRPQLSTSRPLTLTLKKTEKYKLSVNKPNQSLPESPVSEELKALKEACKKNTNGFIKFAQKRRSCSYFIGLNDNPEEINNIAKSFESLPAMNEPAMNELSDEGDGDGNFSDDSLESDYKNPPRRCVSEYQINLSEANNENKSFLTYPRKKLNDSQESILSDASGEVFDCQYDNDRHSSASFFLSRRKMQAAASQESVLTDATDDYQTFPLRENEDHRSTESILSDDSDSLVKSAPLEMLFDSHYRRKRQNSETYNGNPKNMIEKVEESKPINIPTPTRAVFRSKSLQDTRLSAIKNGINYTEENFRPNRTIYYEFNVDDSKDYSSKLRSSQRPDGTRSNSLKEPHSMLILDNFVPHKPPKPKRNFSRTQSMRNRTRPAWNKYNVDIQPRQASELNTKYSNKESLAHENQSKQATIEKSDIKSIENCSLNISKHYESLNNQEMNKISTQYPEASKNVDNTNKLMNNDYNNRNNSNISGINKIACQELKIEVSRIEDVDADSGFENQVPTKDTFEAYDSLEPNGTSSCDVSTSDSQTQDSNKDAEKKFDALNSTVDIRISRAIEGTVKLLSKEFENLVRREQQYLVTERHAWRAGKDPNQNFSRQDIERYSIMNIRREMRPSSGGEDSDCAMDKSLMESGSSTPGSSCANSPKRIWPPASRCQLKWTKTLPTISQDVLPSKHHFAVSGKVNAKNSNTSSRSGTGVNHTSGMTTRYNSSKSHSTYMTRSSSVGVLNQQSDSESDAGMVSSGRNWANSTTNNRMSGLMRPTISSQNKINHQTKPISSSNSNLPMVLRRRGMQSAYSSVNLSQVGNQEDSSSEDTSSNGNGVKPALPPRPRSINIDLSTNLNSSGTTIRRSGSAATISNGRPVSAVNQSNLRLSSRNQMEQGLQELPSKDEDSSVDIANAELNTDRRLVSPQLCNTIADELTRTADNVVQLYKRLTMDNSGTSSNEAIDKETMLKGLESSVNEAMRTLRLVAAGTSNKEATDNDSPAVNEAAETFQELLAGQDQGKVVNIMQQYSELLLNMMKQRMSGTQPNHA
ncbi:uncharacterized protein Wdr62 isoform X1 [Chelonus insularis]|uniref:uncharacterized protein Wdr62 isoform X1 n=1 Tax=Chelonus insularis TaxID=460826 RepID=UPI00158F08A5|nr:uncharacterized protein LOC118064829 isoform X1 [Chelonus insularis]XP_034935593.1 uncharacterized protein LOC118064829 isoform X1 [Chelonus insularis]